MTTLLLRLAAPLQAWGASSRFTRRGTERFPTRSGVLGLVAAAQGRRRTDPITDLASLRFGVRVDQPGRIETDFQTAITAKGKSMPLTYRDYLTDAAFLVGIEGESELVAGIADALRNPRFPLYLGRRSCPPEGTLVLELVDAPLDEALTNAEWVAAPWWRRREKAQVVTLDLLIDAPVGADSRECFTLRDVPISFDPERREHGWREVLRTTCTVSNPNGRSPAHDPFAAIGGS